MTRSTRIAVLLATAVVAAVVATAGSAGSATISTLSSWNGVFSISIFGKPAIENFGQTITVPSNVTVLNSFAFEMQIPNTLIFRGEVYAWDGTKATGPALWQSGQMSTSIAGFQLVTFHPNINVTPGAQLVIFATVSRDYAANPVAGGDWGSQSTNSYGGGEFVYLSDSGDPANWTSNPWSDQPGFVDLAFVASFSSDEGVSPRGGSPRGGYCAVAGNTWPDGTPIAPGVFLNLQLGQASSDPHYKGATAAAYFQGTGITCDDPPPGYIDTGTKVSEDGTPRGDAIYEYWAR